MEKVLELIESVHKIGYFASCDGEQAHVRPFGLGFYENGRFWFCTNNTKNVSKQLKDKPFAEIIFCKPDYSQYVRVSGRVVFDNSLQAKTRVMDSMPGVKDLYKSPDNPIFEVFYLEKGQAVLENFPPVTPPSIFSF